MLQSLGLIPQEMVKSFYSLIIPKICWPVRKKVSNASGKINCKTQFSPVYAMKAHMARRGIAPLIRSLGTGWRLMVSFTPLPLYSRRRKPVPTGSWVGHTAGMGVLKKAFFFVSTLIRTQVNRAHSAVALPSKLSRLPY
jgi:hypothetical protein